jgi:hypothetical protein
VQDISPKPAHLFGNLFPLKLGFNHRKKMFFLCGGYAAYSDEKLMKDYGKMYSQQLADTQCNFEPCFD